MNTQSLLLVVFILSTLYVTIYGGDINHDINREHVALIESYMNKSVDPCVDFYEYACGNYGQVHNTSDSIDSVRVVMASYTKEFQRILEDLNHSTLPQEYHFVANAFEYFNSCLTAGEFQPMNILNWLQVHENLVWPSILPSIDVDSSEENEGNTKKNFSWITTLATLRKYGLNGVFLTELPHQMNASHFIMHILEPTKFNVIEDTSEVDLDIIFYYLGLNPGRQSEIDKFVRMWKEFIKFETKLQKLFDTNADGKISIMTVGSFGNIWIAHYIRGILGEAYNIQIEVAIGNVKYLNRLVIFLANYEPEFLCRYIMVRYVIHLKNTVPKNMNRTQCVKYTLAMLDLPMNWLYEKYNSHLLNDKDDIEVMFKKLLNNLKRVLNDNENKLSDEIRTSLNEKADGMILKIGNLPRPSTAEKLEDFYKGLNLTSKSYYENHLRALSFRTQALNNRLSMKVPQNESYFKLTNDIKYYGYTAELIQISNIVILPVTFLNRPIHHQDFHNILKYSSLGSILGHEIIHAFDKTGVHMDKMGNTPSQFKAILESERYSMNLHCLDWKHPDKTGEIIADLTGLILAFEAYFGNGSNSQYNVEKIALPWTSIPPERLFFLSYAQFYCSAIPASDFENDEHPADNLRVLGALSNYPEFSRVYECPLGSPMNPDKKCQIWHSV